jgi:hypothetical protein
MATLGIDMQAIGMYSNNYGKLEKYCELASENSQRKMPRDQGTIAKAVKT